MSQVAILLADGFEEIEALTVVDVLRRADIEIEMVGWQEKVVGAHQIEVKVDRIWHEEMMRYQMLVLPGGLTATGYLKNQPQVIDLIKAYAQAGKWLAAICAAPLILDHAGLLVDRSFTCHDSVLDQIQAGSYLKATTVCDQRLVTSRGAATALAFAYQLIECLGKSSEEISEAMLYTDVFGIQYQVDQEPYHF